MKKKLALLATAAVMAAVLPAGPAAAAPAIQLLNPSGYTTTPELSTKVDIDGMYHFVAWVPSLPPNPIVEFEIQTAAGNALRTIDARLVGTDTFEGFDNLAGLADGAYVVVARLFSDGTQVDEGSDTQAVTVRNSTISQSETVEISQPSNGGVLGFFTPKGARPRAIVDVRTSENAQQVRVLVTTSRPGTEPTWTQCGFAAASGGSARIRCTLPEEVEPTAVTALAAVANQTPPPGPPQPAADDAGDAHRVTTYAAVPTQLTIDPEADRAEVSTCRYFAATVTDQFGRPLSAANVDVHGVGPTDQLQFASGGSAMDFQPPDSGPHSSEIARRCDDLAPERRQGETNRIGAPDEKHIESRLDVTHPGTNNSGVFTFALFSDLQGGTNIIAWADVNDDDVQQPDEASGGARLGWGQDPPPETKQVFLEPSSSTTTVGDCVRMVLTIKEGGDPAAGRNADVHISSSDTTFSFCTPSDPTGTRAPDQGEHVAGSHADGTQHIEGELDFLGRLIFGVTAPSQGRVVVQGWLDETDDDALVSGEPAQAAIVNFAVSGERDISLDASRNRVRKGRRVRLFGAISGAEACSADQKVRLQARIPGRKFKLIKSTTTNASGEYTFRVRVRYTKDYRAIAIKEGVCERTRSNTVRVRAK